MSNCKEGEGLYYLDSVLCNPFIDGERYTIILMGDNEIRVVTQVTAGTPSENDDVRLYKHDTSEKTLITFRLPFFSANYIKSFDLIIRSDEKTLEMIPNIGHTR